MANVAQPSSKNPIFLQSLKYNILEVPVIIQMQAVRKDNYRNEMPQIPAVIFTSLVLTRNKLIECNLFV